MHYFEEKLFSVYKFPHWFRYVNDPSVLVPSITDFSKLLSYVKSIGRYIQRTFDVENDNYLSFFDALVSRHIDCFLMIVCRI